MQIEPLTELTVANAHRLIVGYESPARFVIRKTEGRDHVVFDLNLEEIPFSKKFPVRDAMIEWYGGLLAEGLSFCAREGGEMIAIAVAGFMEWNGTVTLWEIHVDPAHRRKGVARALLQRVEAAAARKPARRVWIETQTTNLPAVELYRSVGYEIAGFDIWYYANVDPPEGEVALFMQKKLTAIS